MDPLLAAGAPIVLALVQTLAPLISDRWKPLVSLAFGLLVAVAFAVGGELPWPQVPLAGLIVGLAASGLYSGGRTTIGAK